MSTETTDPNATTDPTPPAESPAAAPTGPPASEGATDTENAAQGVEGGEESGNSEAARHRRKTREVERERDTLAARVTALQTREVERIAAEQLAVGGDLLALSGVELAALLDGDGLPDLRKVREAATALLGTRPGLRAADLRGNARAGIGQERPGATPPAGTSWGGALRRSR